MITQECEKENIHKQKIEPRRSPRQRVLRKTPKTPIFVSQSAINETLRHAVETDSPIYIPDKLKQERNKTKIRDFDLQEVCNGVVHPITGDTITKYKTLANDPTTKSTWEESMCVELGSLLIKVGRTRTDQDVW